MSFSRGTGTNKIILCPDQPLTGSQAPIGPVAPTHRCTPGPTHHRPYGGDTGYGGSAATAQQTVNKIPTTTSVSSLPNPSRSGQRGDLHPDPLDDGDGRCTSVLTSGRQPAVQLRAGRTPGADSLHHTDRAGLPLDAHHSDETRRLTSKHDIDITVREGNRW